MKTQEDYLDFKLSLVEKTYNLYIQRLNIWENQFYQIKYGCISIIIILLGFQYTSITNNYFLNYLALATTVGLWLFESALRTTASRYIVKLDLLTEIINDKDIMSTSFADREINVLRILDFDIRSITIRKTINEYVKSAYTKSSDIEQNDIAKNMYKQKRKLISIWNSLLLKNNLIFYLVLLLLQIIAMILIA